METVIKTKIWLSSPHMGEMEQVYVKEALETNFTDVTWEDLFNRKLCLTNDSNLKGNDFERIVVKILKIIL